MTTQQQSFRLALNILESLKEADNLYTDYQEDEDFTNEDYEDMLKTLRHEIRKI
jgi:hypothetical protein